MGSDPKGLSSPLKTRTAKGSKPARKACPVAAFFYLAGPRHLQLRLEFIVDHALEGLVLHPYPKVLLEPVLYSTQP